MPFHILSWLDSPAEEPHRLILFVDLLARQGLWVQRDRPEGLRDPRDPRDPEARRDRTVLLDLPGRLALAEQYLAKMLSPLMEHRNVLPVSRLIR